MLNAIPRRLATQVAPIVRTNPRIFTRGCTQYTQAQERTANAQRPNMMFFMAGIGVVGLVYMKLRKEDPNHNGVLVQREAEAIATEGRKSEQTRDRNSQMTKE